MYWRRQQPPPKMENYRDFFSVFLVDGNKIKAKAEV